MTEQPPLAYLSHHCPGRARLKFAANRGSTEYFARLSALLAEAPGVIAVTANAVTASLLILHKGPLSDVLDFAQSRELVRLSKQPVHARSQVVEADEISLKTLATMAVLGLGVVQLLRGEVLGPASQLFGLAWHMLREPAGMSADNGSDAD
jgi:hypothetical protein